MTLPVPDLSICIVNWNSKEDLVSCLDSMAGVVSSEGYEVIVVDNASSDGSAELIPLNYGWVAFRANSENLGFAKASNQAIKASRGRYVLLLNPDTRVAPGSLEKLVLYADRTPDAGVIGCKVLNPDGSLQYSCRRFPTILAGLQRNTPIGKLLGDSKHVSDYLMKDWDHQTALDVDWVSGAALMIRRDVIERVGLLDERFFMYCEDTDYCRRTWEAGLRVSYYPDAVVAHAIGRSSDQVHTRMLIEFHKSMYSYYRKYNTGVAGRFRCLAVAGGLIARAALIMANTKLLETRDALRLGGRSEQARQPAPESETT